MKAAWWCVLAVAGALGVACAMGGSPAGTGAEAVSGKDPLQLIGEALERGEIDPDTAVLYRVYAVVDAAKLPPQYRGERPLRDGTPVLRDARSRFEGLRPEVQRELEPYLYPRGKP